MKVELFIPCYIDQCAPQIAWNTVKLLEKLGCQVHYNPKTTCCGQTAYQQGYLQEAREIALKFLEDVNSDSAYMVAPSPSCVGMIRASYTALLGKDAPLYYETIQRKTLELSEFITDILKIRRIPEATLEGKAMYVESCASKRVCGIQDAPLKLLKTVNGLHWLETPDAEVCCGAGGAFAMRLPAIATAMAEQKIDNASFAQADYIVSTEASCLLHLEGYINRQGKKIKCLHLADVLTSGWEV